MTKPDYTLLLVSNASNQVTLHADAKGLSALIESLEELRRKAEQGVCEHDHFFVQTGGNGQLSNLRGLETDGEVVYHLKLCGWTSEWARKHGFLE